MVPVGVAAALVLKSAMFVRPPWPGSGDPSGVLRDLGQIQVAWPGVRCVTGVGWPGVAGLWPEVSSVFVWEGVLDC